LQTVGGNINRPDRNDRETINDRNKTI
jgi:hypothetical protein